MEKPELQNFNLSENSIPLIESFNENQEKQSWKVVHVLIFFVGLIFAIYVGWQSLWIIFSSYALIFPVFILHWLATIAVFPEHKDTKKLESYRKQLGEFELYQRKLKEDYWFSLSGYQFEAEITKILKPFFKNIVLTKGSGDGGVDIIVEKYDDRRIIIQCKAHKKPIGPEPIRALLGVMKKFSATEAVFICLGGFTKGAKDESRYESLFMMDINDVIRMHEDANSNEIKFAGKSIRISIAGPKVSAGTR